MTKEPKRKNKAGAGRPPLSSSGETMQEYRVTLPPSVADYIRSIGTPIGDNEGNLSDGIRRLAEWYRLQRDVAMGRTYRDILPKR